MQKQRSIKRISSAIALAGVGAAASVHIVPAQVGLIDFNSLLRLLDTDLIGLPF